MRWINPDLLLLYLIFTLFTILSLPMLNCSCNSLDFYYLTCYFISCVIKVIAQLKERWTEDKNDRKSRRSVSLFVSPTADHVAIAFRSQITFLCKDNNYQMPTGTFNSKSDLCGIWMIILLRFWVLTKMRLELPFVCSIYLLLMITLMWWELTLILTLLFYYFEAVFPH